MSMPVPAWYGRVKPHPDYGDARIILIDSNTLLDLTARGAWTPELEFMMNSPPERLRLKVNAQVFHETLGAGAEAKLPASILKAQRDFVDAYRTYGKITMHDGLVPFFATGRLTIYQELDAALAMTGNLSRPDRAIATDAIANRIPLFTRDDRMRDGLSRALNNRGVKAIIKAHGLPGTLGGISLRD